MNYNIIIAQLGALIIYLLFVDRYRADKEQYNQEYHRLYGSNQLLIALLSLVCKIVMGIGGFYIQYYVLKLMGVI